MFLDVYKDEKDIYVRPMKVWNRYFQTMFRPYHLHREDNSFTVLSDGTEVSRFYGVMNRVTNRAQDQNVNTAMRNITQ